MGRCCVPLCDNNEKTPGIKMCRFIPDKKKQKEWLKRIRRQDFEVTFDSRICSYHFTGDRKEGPTRFAWNESKNFKINKLSCDTVKKVTRKRIQLDNETCHPITPKRIRRGRFCDNKTTSGSEDYYKNQNGSSENIIYIQMELDEAKLLIKEQEKEIESLRKRVTLLSKFEDEVKLLKIAEEKEKTIKTEEKLRTNTKSGKINICKTMFNECYVATWKKETVTAFTGLQDYSSIQILSKMLERKKMTYQKGGCPKLSLKTQVLITLFKLKLDLSNEVLSYLFGISTAYISKIFNSVLIAIYELFYEGEGPLAKIISREKTEESLPKCFSQIPNCRIVLDCTEFTMQGPSKMNEKKIVYSNYKSRYTMKVLVGCAPNGTVTFVSSLFGGSESDKSIVLRSGVLEQMSPGDLILADKGFQLYDILPPGVSLNIPSFLVNNQFTVSETVMNLVNTRARVIIERLNARFNVFKILECIKAVDRSKAEIIVKVCIALTLLMPTLMAELN